MVFWYRRCWGTLLAFCTSHSFWGHWKHFPSGFPVEVWRGDEMRNKSLNQNTHTHSTCSHVLRGKRWPLSSVSHLSAISKDHQPRSKATNGSAMASNLELKVLWNLEIWKATDCLLVGFWVSLEARSNMPRVSSGVRPSGGREQSLDKRNQSSQITSLSNVKIHFFLQLFYNFQHQPDLVNAPRSYWVYPTVYPLLLTPFEKVEPHDRSGTSLQFPSSPDRFSFNSLSILFRFPFGSLSSFRVHSIHSTVPLFVPQLRKSNDLSTMASQLCWSHEVTQMHYSCTRQRWLNMVTIESTTRRHMRKTVGKNPRADIAFLRSYSSYSLQGIKEPTDSSCEPSSETSTTPKDSPCIVPNLKPYNC